MGGAAKGTKQYLGDRVPEEATDAFGQFMGSGQDAGVLGTGQYRTDPYKVDRGAFTDDRMEPVRNRYRQEQARFESRTGPTAGRTAIGTKKQSQFRTRQMSLADALQEQAAGRGPSLAESQLQRATDANIAQSMALAASQRGQTAGQGLRQIAQQSQAYQQQAARDAADMRIQEQLAARGQLGSVLQSGRGQDINLASSQAQLDQARRLANQNAALQQTALNDQQSRFYAQGIAGIDKFNAERAMDLEKLRAQSAMSAKSQNLAAYQDASKNRAGFMSGAAEGIGTASMSGGAAGLVAMSDKDAKKNVVPAEDKLEKFLAALEPYQYEYKNPEHGEGDFISPMAQDLEKSELGRGMVADTPEGKAVDYSRAGGVMLATAAMLNDRMSELEQALKNRKKG